MAMDPFTDADDIISRLPPLSDAEYAKALESSFSLFIERLDIDTLDFLRTMFLRNYASDPHQKQMLEILDGEALLRTCRR
jgi:hypothetical protein